MNAEHYTILNNDFTETNSLSAKIAVKAKLSYYFFQRMFADVKLKRYLKNFVLDRQICDFADKLLLDQGGMFKSYVYSICDKFKPLKGSSVLIPGIGYGRNLFQLAAFRPKLIVAFDLYEYPDEWEYLSREIKKTYGTEVTFLKGGFDVLPNKYEKSFDFILSDAVLEHIKDLKEFSNNSARFLREGGFFYASFGPLWFGPFGDHIAWGQERMFDHILLPESEYQDNFKERFGEFPNDSTNGGFLVAKKLFSYLSIHKYFDILKASGFRKKLSFVNISSDALSFFKKNPAFHNTLNENNVPSFDRFCKAVYLWMRLQSS
ncbi:MAG: methyltransferase domain-containing protein [Candidatus Omnitrophota bacterium]